MQSFFIFVGRNEDGCGSTEVALQNNVPGHIYPILTGCILDIPTISPYVRDWRSKRSHFLKCGYGSKDHSLLPSYLYIP